MEKPQPLCQRIDRATVAQAVHRFYAVVLDDPRLAPYFAHIDDWPLHEAHISDFWWGVMGGTVASPRPRAMELGHRDLQFGPQELERWLSLFEQTLQQELPEDIAREWSALARQLGKAMTRRGMVRGE